MTDDRERKRFLSAATAADCENATSPASTCRCRCGGALHGVNVLRADGLRPDTWELRDTDPHRSRPPTPKSVEAIERMRAVAEAARQR